MAYIQGEVGNVATTPSNREFETVPPGRFIALSVHAGEVFANQQKALAWLQTPNPSLKAAHLWRPPPQKRVFRRPMKP
jgi:hypothetical protein